MNNSREFVKRPGFGNEGEKLKLKANYFEIKNFPDIIYHYNVSINPSTSLKLSNIIFEEFQNNNEYLQQTMLIFDGVCNAFSSIKIKVNEIRGQIISSKNFRNSSDKAYTVVIKLVNTIYKDTLINFIRGTYCDNYTIQNYLMCLNIVFKRKALELYPVIKSSYFLKNELQEISGGLQIYQGYYQSCKLSLNRLLLNVNSASTVFYSEDLLIISVAKLLNYQNVEELKKGISQEHIEHLSSFLKGVQIQVDHRQNKLLKFRIDSISQKSAQELTFMGENLEKTNVVDYFKNRYNLYLEYSKLPCVKVKGDQYLPMEICKLAPNQKYMKKLSEKQNAEVIKFTCIKPQEKFGQIQKSIKSYIQKNAYLDAFIISVNTNFIEVKARLLPPPTLNYLDQNNVNYEFTPKLGVWDMRGKKFVNGGILNSWGVLNLCHPKEVQKAQIENFIRELVKVSCNSGLKILNRNPQIELGRANNIITSLQKLNSLIQNSVKVYPQLIICILPVKSTDLYADIKRICDTVLGVPTQCIILKHTYQPKIQYLSNLALKINSKIGGSNTYLVPESVRKINSVPTMILGADISNPGAYGKGASIASIVASTDRNFCTWFSKSCKQPPKQDIIVDIKNMMIQILTKFRSCHKILPIRVIFYRDGASEGQYSAVKSQEIKGIRDSFAELGKTHVDITFIMVVKRHHTRFLAPIEFQDRSGNCLPGTVIDRDVTHPREFDFFLFSHSGIQGTSRPVHYHVLEDDNNFNADSLQALTYSLCHIQSRCTRSVSLVTPVYYAHLLGNRIRIHMHSLGVTDNDFNENESRDVEVTQASQYMCSKLFFI